MNRGPGARLLDAARYDWAMGKPHSKPRRIVTRLIVFLLLGAIINVAVAWGCAYRSETQDQARDAIPSWPRPVPDDWPSTPDRGWQFSGIGLHVMMIDGHGPEPDGRWVGDRYVGSWHADLYRFAWFRAGLPLLSMHWCLYDMMPEARGTLDHWPDRPHGLLESGLKPVAYLLHDWQWSHQRRLPLAILWFGFAINTIFYATILWMLCFVPGVLRRKRRLKRGLCIYCAYDLRGAASDSANCPECGEPLARLER